MCVWDYWIGKLATCWRKLHRLAGGTPPAPPGKGEEMAREKKITVRLTEEQYEEVERARGKLSRSEFLYLLLLDYLERPELSERLRQIQSECLKKCKAYRKLHGELGKIGSNVNQIARALNAKRLPAKEKKLLTDLALETIELIQDLKQKLAEERIGSPQENSQ